MTKRMSSALLNELSFFTEKLEILKQSDEDKQFIVFMSEILEKNIEIIQEKLTIEDSKLNNKFMFLTTGKSLKLPEVKNEEQERFDAETLKMMTIQPNSFPVTGVTGFQGYFEYGSTSGI